MGTIRIGKFQTHMLRPHNMNITSIENGLKRYIRKHEVLLNSGDIDLISEIHNKLKIIQSRDEEIKKLVKGLHNSPEDIFYVDEQSGKIFAFGKSTGIAIKRKSTNVPIRVAGRSEGWPRAYKGGLVKLKTQLEENVINNYEDMHRIYNICRELPQLSKFKPKGVVITRNKLIAHAGEKSGVTFDSFSVDTISGPRVKGFRKVDQKDIFPNSGYYYKDSEQFIDELDRRLIKANS